MEALSEELRLPLTPELRELLEAELGAGEDEDADAAQWVLDLVARELGDGVEEPGEPDPVVEPGKWIGGPIRKGAVSGKLFRTTLVPENKDYVDCEWQTGERTAIGGKAAPGARILGGRIKGLRVKPIPGKGRHAIYLNQGHEETPSRIVLQGIRLEDCVGGCLAEMKGTGWVAADLVQRGCKLPGGIRIRHGRGNRVLGGNASLVSVRGWEHVLACPASPVELHDGTVAPRYRDWKGEHDRNKGHAWQSAAVCRVLGARNILVGASPGYSKRWDFKYKAADNVIDMALRGRTTVAKAGASGTRFEAMDKPGAALEGLSLEGEGEER